MGETTKIQWCHHTLNPWIGCVEVSPACAHCYAKVSTPARVMRSKGEETWGADGVRHETRSWPQDLRRWNREAIASGERRRVFCGSLMDVFERHPALDAIRQRLWTEVEQATGLDVLLLTKRPENVLEMVPKAWEEAWPAHVWLGTTVEDQERAVERIPPLLEVDAPIRFLSVEPLLGALDLTEWIAQMPQERAAAAEGRGGMWMDAPDTGGSIDWIIVGGESGPKARPFNLEWARALRDQCQRAGVYFFLKQLGAKPVEYFTMRSGKNVLGVPSRPPGIGDAHGGNTNEWPEDLRVREMPR